MGSLLGIDYAARNRNVRKGELDHNVPRGILCLSFEITTDVCWGDSAVSPSQLQCNLHLMLDALIALFRVIHAVNTTFEPILGSEKGTSWLCRKF